MNVYTTESDYLFSKKVCKVVFITKYKCCYIAIDITKTLKKQGIEDSILAFLFT